ncbi:MAG: DUF1015 domain-containing protein [Candidatus Kaelpia aquatica]|nr:DUF1015 domain-containing protein [Candidatus Kaelpia aquatica]
MAKIKPFKGLLYNSDKVDPVNVVAPPYDVIMPQGRDDYYESSPYNVIRLILNKSSQPYREAGLVLNKWIEENVLVFDSNDSIYLYRQKYNYRGNSCSRYGFISLLKLESPGSDVLPHEKTYEGPKKDRFSLLEEVEANLSPIFATFSDKDRELLKIFKDIEKRAPIFSFDFEGVDHALWGISEKESLDKIVLLMSSKSILIADGHHRYEVALNYRNMRHLKSQSSSEESYDYLMSYFAPIEQDGLIVLPTHRLVKLGLSEDNFKAKLSDYFEIEDFIDLEVMLAALEKLQILGFGVSTQSGFSLLKIRPNTKERFQKENNQLFKFDVTVLHDFILGEIFDYKGAIVYKKDEEEAVRELKESGLDTAFFLKPIPIEHIIDVAEKKLLMPQKSTYFYPKILTGLLFHKF